MAAEEDHSTTELSLLGPITAAADRSESTTVLVAKVSNDGPEFRARAQRQISYIRTCLSG